ncbi:MAG: methyltransferase [Sphingomonas sp.]|nr:methyltransferase [Sphingomonas sp.]
MNFSADQAQRNRAFARRASSGPLWMFFRGFIKHPVMVGSVIPSSKLLIDKMLEPVDWQKCKLFVEYGPGVGTFTQHILDRLAPNATLLTIDTNPDFTSYLNSKFTDSRMKAVTGSAADVREIMAELGFEQADYVLSGIPFSTLPPGIGEDIARATSQVIRTGGAFLVYQFSSKVFDFIEPWFNRIERAFEWINVPPARLFWAHKDGAD